MEYNEYKEKMEKESGKLIKDFSGLVNNYNFDTESLIKAFSKEHRTLQQNMFRTIVELICFMASDEYLTDGRNEYSKGMAKNFIAGYAEDQKQKEKGYYLRSRYSEEEAEQKAEEYRKQIIAEPKKHFRIPFV
jgi:hypothetical protein